MRKIFTISGLAKHGKDATAQIIKDKIGGKTLILHQADYLKYIARQYIGWNGEKDEYGRTLLQQLGTEKTRIGMNRPLFWAEKTCDVIEILKNDFDYFIIPDTRFKNEIYYTKARFPESVFTIKVVRTDFESELNKEQKNHISEKDLDDFKFDWEIHALTGMNHLESAINLFMAYYNKIE